MAANASFFLLFWHPLGSPHLLHLLKKRGVLLLCPQLSPFLGKRVGWSFSCVVVVFTFFVLNDYALLPAMNLLCWLLLFSVAIVHIYLSSYCTQGVVICG